MNKPLSLNPQQECALAFLNAHRPLDEEERLDVERMKNFITRHPDCYGKQNSLGHVTGSAFVLDPEHRILLTFHGKLERWLQLGGHSDNEESSPAETALREAREESGLSDLVFHPTFGTQPIDVDIHVIPARQREPAHEHLDFRFVFLTEKPGEIVVSAESKRLAWWPIKPVPNLGFDTALTRALGKVSKGISESRHPH